MNVDEAEGAGCRAPRIRVAAVIVRDGAVLLIRHAKEGRTYWLLPGGGVDYGEPLGAALIREVKEETNLDIRPLDVVFVNDSIPPDGRRHIVNVYFTAEVQGGIPTLGEEENLSALRFVPAGRLAHLDFYPDIREWLVPGIEAGFAHSAPYLGNLWS